MIQIVAIIHLLCLCSISANSERRVTRIHDTEGKVKSMLKIIYTILECFLNHLFPQITSHYTLYWEREICIDVSACASLFLEVKMNNLHFWPSTTTKLVRCADISSPNFKNRNKPFQWLGPHWTSNMSKFNILYVTSWHHPNLSGRHQMSPKLNTLIFLAWLLPFSWQI